MNAWIHRLSRPGCRLGFWQWRWGKWELQVMYDVVTACARLWVHRHELQIDRYVSLWPRWSYDICWNREMRTIVVFPFFYARDTVTTRQPERERER